MKKNASRIIALALVVMMALALIPLGAHAEAFTITFDPNGGDGAAYVATTDANGKYTIQGPKSYAIKAPEGKVFKEWNGAQNGGATSHWIGKEVELTDHNWTLYAQWAEAVTVSFDLSGGEGDMSAFIMAKGGERKLPAFTGEREGFTFTGWVGDDGASYADEATITPQADLVLTAQWRANTPEYVTVNFLPGNENAAGSMADQQVPYNTPTALNPNAFTLAGCTFSGWTDGETSYPDGAMVTFTEDTVLVGDWTLNTGSGSGSGSGKTAGAVAALSHEGLMDLEQALNRKATALGTTRQNTRNATYYVWCLWDEVFTDKLNADEISAEAAKGNLDFSVTPPEYLGEVSGPVYAYLFQGGALTPVEYTTSQSGYSFSGSILNPNVGDDCNILVLLAVPQSSQTSETITFQFDANGGGGNMADVVLPVTAPFYAPQCAFDAPANKRFAHWCTSADGTIGTVYNPGEMVEKNAEFSQLKLFAIWQDISSSAVALNGSVAVSPTTATVGQTLTATFTATAGDAAGITYQWMRGVAPIANATASTYTTTEADAGSSIHCEVTDATGTRHFRSNSVNVTAPSKGTPGATPVSSSTAIPEQVVEGQKRNLGAISGAKSAVYDVRPCWNGDSSKPMSAADIAAALAANHYIPFYLDYPSGTGNGGYAFHVYHYGADGLKPVHAEDTGRNLLVYGTEFSPFLLLAVPTSPAEGSVLIGGAPVVGGTLTAICGTGVTPLNNNSFQWTRNKLNIPGATGGTYKVTADDVGCRIDCKVTTASGQIPSANYVVPTVGINPTCTQGVYNDGETATGVISNVTPEMEYIREADYIANPATAKWTSVTGSAITGLKKGGLYIVRLKASPSVTASVSVPEYYSVRVYEKVKDTRYVDSDGNSAPRHGKLTPTATVVEKDGKVLTVTATPNKNYAVYDIEVNGKSVSWSKVGNDYKVSLPGVDRRTDVDVRFVYTGSSPHTGDDANIALWAELAALSLLGLGAAITVLKKKSKA